nr:hypothetical protein [Tanacetum cinerariifolium]
DKECRNERVIKSYGHQSQYDYYEHDTYHVGYNIEMKDYMMYQGDYGDQYYHSSNESPSFINQPQRPTQEYYYQAFETHVDRLLEQLNKDETYEPQCITMLDFDKEDEGEDENKEFTLHSTNTMEYLTFDSYKDVEDKDNDNNSFEDLISPVEEHDKESVPFKVGEGVMEANTTPYLPTLKEPILSLVDDIRSKEDEEFWLFRYIRINVQIYWMKLKSLISKIHLNFQGYDKELFDGMTFHEKKEKFQMIEEEFLLSLEETPLQSQQVQQPTLNEVQEYFDCILFHQDVLLRVRGSNK